MTTFCFFQTSFFFPPGMFASSRAPPTVLHPFPPNATPEHHLGHARRVCVQRRLQVGDWESNCMRTVSCVPEVPGSHVGPSLPGGSISSVLPRYRITDRRARKYIACGCMYKLGELNLCTNLLDKLNNRGGCLMLDTEQRRHTHTTYKRNLIIG